MSTPNIRHLFLQLLDRSHFVSMVKRQFVMMSILFWVVVSSIGGLTVLQASAHAACAEDDQIYNIVSGDTLSTIALNNNTTTESLARYNKIADPNRIYVDQQLCIPATQSQSVDMTLGQNQVMTADLSLTDSAIVDVAYGNPYPYGQCTWWANQRYFQLHKVYVPWTINADAWEWTARAQQFHWKVSSKPIVGSIIDLQPWTQGAYGLGHVAVVEKVLRNGHVTASNMNWGGSGSHVVNVDFVPGHGVTFISK